MRKLVLVFLLLLTACLPLPGGVSTSRGRPSPGIADATHPWAGALRALDLPDATDPAHDLTAVYLRQADAQLHIRIDLLDFRNANDLSLDIEIGGDSSSRTTPLAIHVPAKNSPARISLDPLLATVTIDIPLSEIPSRPRVDVSTPEDKLTGLLLDGPVPAQTAPLLLTFYDTFAPRFPAEALRSWDGAHTGPRGERHGLKHLLSAAEEHQVPIVLLDLKDPENLSALDAMGLLPKIQQLEQHGLLILPDRSNQEALFNFSPSLFTWGRMASRPMFAFIKDPSHIYHPLFSKTTFIPIATETDSTQPTPGGPSLEVRRALLDVALNADETDLLVLGGSLRESTWGSPHMAGAALAYFASRPYIHILDASELMAFHPKRGKPELLSLPQDETIQELETHFQNLTQPVLEFVANWRGSPLSSCETDFDKDGQLECVLANEHYIAIFDPRGARLTYLFAVERDTISLQLRQLVGPSWQVAAGLSNSSLWDISAGEAADPGAYPGAFADKDDPFKLYEPAIQGNAIVFTSLDGTRIKTFYLEESGVKVEYQTQETVVTQIPLLVEPESRFLPGWAEAYVQEKTPDGIAWGLRNGTIVRIQAEGVVTMRAFNESLSLLAGPEDPDFDYPPGHTLPFPLAVAEVEVQDGYFLRLERLP